MENITKYYVYSDQFFKKSVCIYVHIKSEKLYEMVLSGRWKFLLAYYCWLTLMQRTHLICVTHICQYV